MIEKSINNLQVIEINNTCSIVSYKVIKKTRSSNNEDIIFNAHIISSPTGVITKKQNIFLRAYIVNIATLGISHIDVEPSPIIDILPVCLVTKLNNEEMVVQATTVDNYNTFFPVKSINGFVHFNIPLSKNQDLSSYLLLLREW